MDDPEPITLAGLKLPVTPEGSPETLKATVPLKPPCPATVMLAVVLFPMATATADGAEIEKPAALEMFKVTDAVCVRLPLVPVTVKG